MTCCRFSTVVARLLPFFPLVSTSSFRCILRQIQHRWIKYASVAKHPLHPFPPVVVGLQSAGRADNNQTPETAQPFFGMSSWTLLMAIMFSNSLTVLICCLDSSSSSESNEMAENGKKAVMASLNRVQHCHDICSRSVSCKQASKQSIPSGS